MLESRTQDQADIGPTGGGDSAAEREVSANGAGGRADKWRSAGFQIPKSPTTKENRRLQGVYRCRSEQRP